MLSYSHPLYMDNRYRSVRLRLDAGYLKGGGLGLIKIIDENTCNLFHIEYNKQYMKRFYFMYL